MAKHPPVRFDLTRITLAVFFGASLPTTLVIALALAVRNGWL